MNKIFSLFFGTPKRAIISVALFAFLGFLNKVAPQATGHVVGSVMALFVAGIGPFVLPIVVLGILVWMLRKLFK